MPGGGPAEAESVGEKFAKLLSAGHKEFCPWKGEACPVSLTAYPVMTAEESGKAFLKRLEALLMLEQLPALDPGTLHDMDELSQGRVSRLLEKPEAILKDLPEDVLRRLADLNGPAARMFASHCILLALSEWGVQRLNYAVDGSGKGVSMCSPEGDAARGGGAAAISTAADKDLASVLLTCDFCGARLGLWNFDIGLRKLTMGRTSGEAHDLFSQPQASSTPTYEPSQNASQLISRLTPVSLGLRNTIAGGPKPLSPVAFPSLAPVSRRRPRSLSPAKRLLETGTSGAGLKKRKSGAGSAKLLDSLKQHRFFCPVICAGERGGGAPSKPGWAATLDHLAKGAPAPGAGSDPPADRPPKDARQAIEIVRGLLG